VAQQKKGRRKLPEPVTFPGIDEHGEPIDVLHYPLEAAAAKMHVGITTLRKYIHSGRWPYQPVGGRKYMTEADFAEALRRERERAVREAQRYGIRGSVVPIDDDELDEPDGDDDRGVL